MNRFGKREDKQEILTAICKALQYTDNAGDPRSNGLKELRYIPARVEDSAKLSPLVSNGKTITEIARPIFDDGTGENGYYDISIGGSGGTSIFVDVANQFIRKMW